MRLTVVDKRWAGHRCIVAASGPALSPHVAELCLGEHVIAVNDAVRLLPEADVLYACDATWWELHDGHPSFAGERWTSHSLAPKNDKRQVAEKYGLTVIAGQERPGFSVDPAAINYGNNSGFQAVNLALLFGADPIILAGFDMRAIGGKSHFFGEHKAPLRPTGSFTTWIAKFTKAAEMLGGSPRIINSTPNSALTCFPYVPLAEALQMAEAA